MVLPMKEITASERVSIAGAKLGCRDPDDDKILETALMGEADCLVTGDRDLLEMSPFCGIPIVAAADLLDSIDGVRAMRHDTSGMSGCVSIM